MGLDIFLQAFTSDGTRDGVEQQINVGTSGQQFRLSLATDPNGNMVVAWRSDPTDGSGSGIVARRFSANGTPLGVESLFKSFILGDQRLTSSGRGVANDSLGNYFIVWDSPSENGNATGVYGTKVILSESPPSRRGATDVAGTSATLHALLDANGHPSTVAFEYDTQSSFLSANVVQAVAFGGLNDETASVIVDGLLKNQTHYFRAKVIYGTMVKVANVVQFTTANAAPAANDDLVFVAGTRVLSNG